MGGTFEEVARGGPLLLAIGAAALAGLVSFLSPCILPLVPGYLSYITGLTGSELERRDAGSGRPAARPAAEGAGPGAVGGVAVAVRTGGAVTRRVLAGTLLFIGGFTVVFILSAVVVARVGKAFFTHQRALEIGVGALIIVLGLAFLGLVPGMQREFRIHRLPAAGLLGAPVFGAVFALSWIPCVGPTLAAVMGMGAVSGTADRAVVLAVAYCLGLGLPFVVFGLAFQRLLGVFRAVRRNSRWVTRIGGALLIVIGLALLSGDWQEFVNWLRATVGVGEVGI